MTESGEVREIRSWATNNWERMNEYVGACPECQDANEDLHKLAKQAAMTGLSLNFDGGIVHFIDNLNNWPRPILSDEAIVDLAPLTIECQQCGEVYQP